MAGAEANMKKRSGAKTCKKAARVLKRPAASARFASLEEDLNFKLSVEIIGNMTKVNRTSC